MRWLPLPTWLENRFPESMAMPGADKRIAFFLTYSTAGKHLDRWFQYRERYDAPLWRVSRWDSAMEEAARAKGVALRKPSPEYGSQFVPV
jgi:hypothetical protein